LPRYDYKCNSCGNLFELKQSFSAKPEANCPDCNNIANRVIQSVPIVFKGSGFYVNDYARSGKTSTTESTSKNKTETNTKTEKSKDLKKSPDSKDTKNSSSNNSTDKQKTAPKS
tara:strand:- start:412 stop:753 length:342 start_codon:yes stop_codon:yes gene_type:complete